MSKSDSRTKRFLYSTATTALYQIVLFLSGFIVPKVILTYYSSEINGLVTSITQFITYFNLVEAGLSGAAIYALYKPLAEHNEDEISRVVVASKKFYFQAGRLFLLLISALAICYPLFVKTSLLSYFEVVALVFVLGMNSVLEFFTLAKYRALLSADQKSYIISFGSIVQVVLNTAIIAFVARFGINIVILRFVALVSVFARTLILMIYVRKKYPYVNYKAKPRTEALNKRWDAIYMQVLGAIHTGAPVIILTFVVKDLTLVSIFSIYNMIITGLHGIMSIFSSGLSAGFGDVIVRKEYSVLQKTYQQFEWAYLSVMTLVYSIAFVMIMPFIKIYTADVTDAQYYLPMIGALIVLNGFLYNLKSPQAMLLIAAGLYKESRWQTTIQGALMVVLGCVLGYFWGIEGILVACIVSNLYRDIDLLFFIPRNITGISSVATFKRWISMSLCFVIIVLIGTVLPIEASGYFTWLIWAIVIALIGVVVLTIYSILLDRKAMLGLLSRLKVVIKK